MASIAQESLYCERWKGIVKRGINYERFGLSLTISTERVEDFLSGCHATNLKRKRFRWIVETVLYVRH